MKCPVCPDATLLMSEKQSVEIDYCPTCRGVWLDRGELDKLIQLAASKEVFNENAQSYSDEEGYRGRKSYSDSGHYPHAGGYRKKSWLWEIFD
jgi:uncharacterized protein